MVGHDPKQGNISNQCLGSSGCGELLYILKLSDKNQTDIDYYSYNVKGVLPWHKDKKCLETTIGIILFFVCHWIIFMSFDYAAHIMQHIQIILMNDPYTPNILL